MKQRILLHLLLLCVTSTVAFIGCDSATEPTDIRQQIAADIGDNVIVPIYKDLDEKGQALLVAVKAFHDNPSIVTRDAARAAWVAARSPFEMGEAFEFGPIEEPPPGLKAYVDTWPIATKVEDNGIEAYLKDSSGFTKENVANYPLNVRGFHAIEYILWGDADFGIAPKMDTNALSFLLAMTEVTVEKFTELHGVWEESGGNFVRELKEYGTGRTYNSVKDALLEINRGVWHIAEELWDEYLFDPIDPGHGPRSAESYLSDNSGADFHDIMAGVKAVYYGEYGTHSGKGLTDFFAEKDPIFDELVKKQIDEAMEAIDALGPKFNETVKNNPAKVETARTKCNALYQSLEQKGVTLISES